MGASTPRQAIWKSDAQFNDGAPTFTDVEVVGTGDAAYLALTQQVAENHVPYTTPGDYIYNPTEIQVSGGAARLFASVAGEQDWPFTTAGNYTFDGAKIEVTGGVAKLKGSPITCYAQWHMNESAGTNVPDSSGNSRDGTCINMEDSDWVPGKLNNCLRFGEGGDLEYVDCGNIGGFDRLDSFSFELWIKTTTTTWPTFINKMLNASPRTGYGFGFQSGVLRLRLINTLNTNSIVVRNSALVNDGVWHHIIVTYDGSSVAAGVRFYVDGALKTGNIVDHDNLIGSITTGSSLLLGFRTGFNYFDGYFDEVVIYDSELSAVEVSARWNGGAGTELMPGAFPVDTPAIYPNTGMAYATNLGQFIETATKPGGTEVKYHVSSDDGVTWKWWDGGAWVATDDTYAQANTAAVVNANINTLPATGTAKFRALLYSSDGSATPELDNVYLAEGVSYPIGSFEIAMGTDIQPAKVYRWCDAIETVVKPAGTDVTYQYSIDAGGSYSGSWLTAAGLKTALAALTPVGDGTDTLRIKSLLSTTDLDKTPELDNVQIDSLFYPDSGTYESVQYAPAGTYLNGLSATKIVFNTTTPAGTSVSVEARFMNHVLEAGYATCANGDEFALCGTVIQWKATLSTTDPGETPRLDACTIDFHTLVGVMLAIDRTTDDLSAGTISAELAAIVGSTTTEVRTGATQADGFYDNLVLVVANATGVVARRISCYSNINGTFTVDPALPFVPSIDDPVYVLNRFASLAFDITALGTPVDPDIL